MHKGVAMGFDKQGLYFIWNNERIRVRFGDGKDYGAHWIMPDPVDNVGSLSVGEFTKIRVGAGIEYITINGDEPSRFERSDVYYEATVSNDAGYAQWFTLQGGGNT
jgi:hypothetical protein